MSSSTMSPLSHQPSPALVLFRQQKSPSCINGGFPSMRCTNHHQRILWLNTTASIKGSTSVAAARDVSASSGDARKIVDQSIHHVPDLWENQFRMYDDHSYVPVTANEQVKKEHQELKEEVWRMLMKIETTPRTSKRGMPLKTKLQFIDTLHRLGVSFHFEKEIGNILQQVYKFDDIYSCGDLYAVCTAFRLLRDQGIYVPARGLFDKLLLEHAALLNEASLVSSSDIDGLLALYEASFCVIPDDEDILDRAQEMTSNKLKSIVQELEMNNQQLGNQCKKIKHVLRKSIKMNCERLVARFYISIYKEEQLEFGESLLKFAVHDFNIRQTGYQRELGAVTKWCEDTHLKKHVPWARHRMVECHYWQLCISSEPQFNIARIIGAKFYYLLALVDDMYDTFGTIEGNELFTEAFAKSDPNAPKLKPHMKAFITAMKSIYDETDQQNPGRPYMLYYLKREAERFLRAYEIVGRWIYSKTIPTYEEYFDVAMISAGQTMSPCICFAGMGEVITEEILSLTLDYPLPKVSEAFSVFGRLLDDDEMSISTNELVDTTIAYLVFAKHYGVSKEESKHMVKKRLSDAFKELNNSMLKGRDDDATGIPRSVLKVMYGHVIPNEIFNRGQDFFTIPSRLKDDISFIYVDPVVL